MFAGGDKVAVEVLIDATSAGGGRFRDEELHLYTLGDDGQGHADASLRRHGQAHRREPRRRHDRLALARACWPTA